MSAHGGRGVPLSQWQINIASPQNDLRERRLEHTILALMEIEATSLEESKPAYFAHRAKVSTAKGASTDIYDLCTCSCSWYWDCSYYLSSQTILRDAHFLLKRHLYIYESMHQCASTRVTGKIFRVTLASARSDHRRICSVVARHPPPPTRGHEFDA